MPSSFQVYQVFDRRGREVSKGSTPQRFGIEPHWGAVVKSWWGSGGEPPAKCQKKLYFNGLRSNVIVENGTV